MNSRLKIWTGNLSSMPANIRHAFRSHSKKAKRIDPRLVISPIRNSSHDFDSLKINPKLLTDKRKFNQVAQENLNWLRRGFGFALPLLDEERALLVRIARDERDFPVLSNGIDPELRKYHLDLRKLALTILSSRGVKIGRIIGIPECLLRN